MSVGSSKKAHHPVHPKRLPARPLPQSTPRLGAWPDATGTTFSLWSSHARQASVRLFRDADTANATLALVPQGEGLFSAHVEGVRAGALYKFVLDGEELVDPYARFLPHGVHGPARVELMRAVAPLRPPVPIGQISLYELHIGTFTPEGTYRAAVDKLSHIASLGVTAIELMPLSTFAGTRGWGYDGVAHYAPFAGYGEPEDLRAFVEAAHRVGLAVVLDVVYNHFGPDGNYLPAYSPEYFDSEVKTAWGDAPCFRHPYMRSYVVENVRYWLGEFGFDGLRLDATHGIVDTSSPHLLKEIAHVAHAFDPPRLVFAEDDRNEAGLVTEMGLDGVWADDFHHSVRVTMTGEGDGYFAAYSPGVVQIARAIERGWLYEGQVHPLKGTRRGSNADALEAPSLVYCIQNHDQVGNRALGTRLNHDVDVDRYLTTSMILLFLPMTPLLFMGQEWAATAPFLFFTDHAAELGARVSKGRREEFAGFAAFTDPSMRDKIPDPQAQSTFARSRLDWRERDAERGHRVMDLYRAMLRLRRVDPVLSASSRKDLECSVPAPDVLLLRRVRGGASRSLVVNLGTEPHRVGSAAGGECLIVSRTGAWSDQNVLPGSAVLLAG